MGSKVIGIYCITNTINGKKYIGQSWDIYTRWEQHKKNPPNDHIASAREKYGDDKFEYSIIRTISNSPIAQILLDVYEQHFIEHYHTMDNKYGYNKRSGGSIGKLSEETKMKISKSHMGIKPSAEVLIRQSEVRKGVKTGPCSQARKDAISRANKGKKRSADFCRRMSEIKRGVKTGPCSELRRKAIYDAKKGKRPYDFERDENGMIVGYSTI